MTNIRRTIITTIALIAIAAVAIPASSAPRPTPTTLSAVVFVEPTTQQATLIRGNNVLSATWIGTDGIYNVTFNRDVSTCTYTATAGIPYWDSVSDDGVILNVAPAANGFGALPNAVMVQEYDAVLARGNGSTGFHLIVEC
jgi:hypothetical protein